MSTLIRGGCFRPMTKADGLPNGFLFYWRQTAKGHSASPIPEPVRSAFRHALYPKADLIRDVDRGRAEMANAIKASILVCDDLQSAVVRNMRDDSSSLQQNYRRLFNAKSKEEVDEIRAAMYNGGPKKYILATGSINPCVQETVCYVKKFNFIRNLNMFE